MYIPATYHLLMPVLQFLYPQKQHENAVEAPQTQLDQPAKTFDLCPKMTVRCVKAGEWPSGIVGDIGKKNFCWRGMRCVQCDIEQNTDECNEKFPQCEEACDPFAPIPF